MHRSEGELARCLEDRWLDCSAQRLVLHVAHNTDDLMRAIFHQTQAKGSYAVRDGNNGFSDRILGRKVTPYKRVIHNHNARIVRRVTFVKIPPAQQRNSDCGEISVADAIVL